MENNIIPICAITDENLTFTVPALFISVLENSSENNFYKFYCFVNDKVTEEDRQKIIDTQNLYENCSVEIIDMKDTYQNCTNRHPFVTNACLYKFAIIDKLTQYDKIIYLDTDIVVNGDISELFNIDLKDNYVGGVFNIYYYMYKKNLPAMLQIPDIESYFNAGVMLMNTKKMREDNLVEQLEKYIGKFSGSVDQHIFNKVCYGKIVNIPPKFNATLNYVEMYKKPYAEYFYTKKEINEAIENPYVIHYTGIYKPWNYTKLPLAWKWYKYYKKSSFGDKQLKRKFREVKKFSLKIYLMNKFLNWGMYLNKQYNLNINYFRFFSVIKNCRQKKISPICIVIKSAKLTSENENILELIKELRQQKQTIFVISKSCGKLEHQFKQEANCYFKLRNIDNLIIRYLRECKSVLIFNENLYKDITKMKDGGISYFWLIQNAEIKNKQKFQKILDSNVIYEFDKEKLISILIK